MSELRAIRAVVAMVGVAHSASLTRKSTHNRSLERFVGAGKVALMQELGVLDSVLDILPESALIMTAEEDPSVMASRMSLRRTSSSRWIAVAVITSLIWPMRLDMPQCYIHHGDPNATRSPWLIMVTEWRTKAKSSCA